MVYCRWIFAERLTNNHLVIGYWSENRSTFVYRLIGSHLVPGYHLVIDSRREICIKIILLMHLRF